jgi:hypothetical protein
MTVENTNNVLTGRVTINIANARPVITTVNFGDAAVYDGIIIDNERPVIKLFVSDFKSVGINQATIRVTVDNTLVYTGPYNVQQVASLPYNRWEITFTYPGLWLEVIIFLNLAWPTMILL